MRFILSFIVSSLIATSALAFELQFPVDCTLGTNCFVQNYVDVDPSPDYKDFTCHKMTYNGHDGTDFRVKDFSVMERGVGVLAAADGVVRGMRDGMDDIGMSNLDAIRNKECGNGVIVDHEGGWQTQYCHMKKGSIRVQKGQKVKAGDILGQIGYSGQTAFPHLHLTVRKDGKTMDPFTMHPVGDGFCTAIPPKENLWSPAAHIRYIPTALLGAGFTTQTPDMDGVMHAKFNQANMAKDAPFLISWVNIMGIQEGDILQMQMIAPDGSVFFMKDETFANPKAVQFTFAGRKRQGTHWEKGSYTGSVTLVRAGQTVFRQPLAITVAE